ncbi:putative bifunctional diguanylate cyclase/phosphodiesterase [Alteromonas sp. P256]|uniref:putative bifunctional diguanylate cyclase/phosphodiesterase n=1 Tax=Alteromonas sp. P256 TaxID=3117399 RepID=UPI002FE1BCEE
MAVFYSILMCVNVICAMSIMLSGISKRKYHFLGLAALNVLMFSYHWLCLELLTTPDINVSLKLSTLHSSNIIVCFPLYVFIFGLWTGYKHTKAVTVVLSLFSFSLLCLNILSEHSIRYGSEPTVVAYETIFSDMAYTLTGEAGAYFSYIHFCYALAGLFLAFSAYRFYKTSQSYLSAAIIFTLTLQIASSYIGYLIDHQATSLVYVAGAPMTLLSLFVVGMISQGFQKKSDKLYSQMLTNESLHNVFSKLAVISNEQGVDNFYKESIALLSEFSQADYVLFGMIDENNSHNVKTKVACKNNVRINNFSYARKGSPCENVLTVNACVHRIGVAAEYPGDKMLEQEGIEAYIGYPIIGIDNYTVGVLVLLFKMPLQSEKTLRTVTDVFATRISAEFRRELLQEELKATAYVDYLTQLPNRIQLLNFVAKTKNTAITEERQALLLLFDLDYFGEINRKYGYEVGDQVIKIIGERLRSYAVDGVFIARCSGDEFAAVITRTKTDISKLANVHWTAISAIITKTCNIGNRKINVNCSMGAVIFPTQLESDLDVLGSAEHALLQAKKQGRANYLFFDPALQSEMEHIRQLESDLADAVEGDDGLQVYYQPKVNGQGEMIGAEALLRWFSKKRGFVSPAEFIPVAEGSGIIHTLGKWVLNTVLSDLSIWRKNGENVVPISINITASQFEDEAFIEDLISSINGFHVPMSLIELELTESGLLVDKGKAIETLSKIRAHEISVALDDFGTGYSSLSYLSELPLDVLKIDKSFVDGLQNERNKELVKSIIAISQAMDLTNVAEGTETLDQVKLLQEYGCKFFQGYYFSKPLNREDFSVWLRERCSKLIQH